MAHLPARGVVAVGGEDRVAFLQGLVSNDVALAAPGRAVWAALLTPQGKWLSDFFILSDGDRLLLDCERAHAATLVQRLGRYRLRSRATLTDLSDAVSVYAAWGGAPDLPAGTIAAPDPRLPEAGWRILSERRLPATSAAAAWDAHRLALGLPDGSRDLEAEKTVLLEAGFDELAGVSWSKGCYMGQELTARTKYRGLLKRRLVPVADRGAAARARHAGDARRLGGRHAALRNRRCGAGGGAAGCVRRTARMRRRGAQGAGARVDDAAGGGGIRRGRCPRPAGAGGPRPHHRRGLQNCRAWRFCTRMPLDWAGLVLKLVAAPALILAASLVGRRWGEAVGGWMIGLPLTSGPVLFLLAMEHGRAFAATTAAGSVAGVVAQAAFCLGYGWMADRVGIAGAFLAGTAGFALAGWVLQAAALPIVPQFVLAAAALAAAIRVFPRAMTPVRLGPVIGNDLPLRMAVAALVVTAITTAAPWLGPRLSGLLTTFPIMASILSIFAQRSFGPGAARRVLFGLLLGLFGFATFFVVLGCAIEPFGIAVAFAAAAASAILVQGGSLLLVRRKFRAASL